MNDARPHGLQRGWLWLAALVFVGLLVAMTVWRPDRRPAAKDEFKTQRYIIPQSAVAELAVRPVAEVNKDLDDDELVLGVSLGNESRAYPLNMLNAQPQTKVLNDVLGGRPIAVTWCDRCRTGIAYDRVVHGQTLTLAVFGSLWRDSMVLYDQETMTQWSQWEGKAKMGSLRGAALERLPSVLAVWGDWKRQYPDGSVVWLDERRHEFDRDTFRNGQGCMVVIGAGATAKAWSLAQVADSRVVNDQWQGKAVAVFYLESSGTAQVFERQLGERPLTFRWEEGAWHDDVTGSTWNAMTGVAAAGSLRGQRLRAVPSMLTSQTAWKQFQTR